MDPVFEAFVSGDGEKLSLVNRRSFDQVVKTLAGQHVDVIVRKHRKQRTSQANRYYHGVVVKLLAEHCGYHPDEMHQVLAMAFLRIDDDPVTGAPRRKRTPDCNSKEFTEYVDRCIHLATEQGVYIPQPGEVDY